MLKKEELKINLTLCKAVPTGEGVRDIIIK
jgi:hypothetical protein